MSPYPHESPNEWSLLDKPLKDSESAKITPEFSSERFPYAFQQGGFKINPEKVTVLIHLVGVKETEKELTLHVTFPSAQPEALKLLPTPGFLGGLANKDLSQGSLSLGKWILELKGSELPESLRKKKVLGQDNYYALDSTASLLDQSHAPTQFLVASSACRTVSAPFAGRLRLRSWRRTWH